MQKLTTLHRGVVCQMLAIGHVSCMLDFMPMFSNETANPYDRYAYGVELRMANGERIFLIDGDLQGLLSAYFALSVTRGNPDVDVSVLPTFIHLYFPVTHELFVGVDMQVELSTAKGSHSALIGSDRSYLFPLMDGSPLLTETWWAITLLGNRRIVLFDCRPPTGRPPFK